MFLLYLDNLGVIDTVVLEVLVKVVMTCKGLLAGETVVASTIVTILIQSVDLLRHDDAVGIDVW